MNNINILRSKSYKNSYTMEILIYLAIFITYLSLNCLTEPIFKIVIIMNIKKRLYISDTVSKLVVWLYKFYPR